MRTHRSMLLTVTALLLSAASEAAPARDCSRNAALGYWMAMAEMENPDVPAALAEQLERTARGDAPWDARLAPVVDANRAALATMQRAAALPFCDWGLDYARDAEAPIAHLVRARALARLNVLQGLQRLQQGKAAEAASAWASGLRFSRDIAVGAPLIGALEASGLLQAHMHAIEGAQRQLPPEKLREIARFLSSLPEDGFDWGATIDVELGAAVGLQERLAASDDPCTLLRGLVAGGGTRAEQDRAVAAHLGVPVERLADRQAVKQAVARGLAAMRALRPKIVAAFRLPYAQSAPAVRALVATAQADPTLAKGWLSLAKANEESRAGLVRANARLLVALGDRKAPDVPLAAILDRAGAYVRRYTEAFRNVLADETSQQWLRGEWATTSAEMGVYGSPRADQRSGTRTLRCEIVWVAIPGGPSWGAFRDVIELDGRRLDHEGRLARLFVASPASTAAMQAREISEESSRRWLGPRRDVNLPTRALVLLLPENQRRFEFERKGERTIAGVGGVQVEFRELASPTLVRDQRGRDVPSRGRFWIDPTHGVVLRSEIEYGNGAEDWQHRYWRAGGYVATEYRPEPGFAVLVPGVMKELGSDVSASGGAKLETTARYAKYRRFAGAAHSSAMGEAAPRE